MVWGGVNWKKDGKTPRRVRNEEPISKKRRAGGGEHAMEVHRSLGENWLKWTDEGSRGEKMMGRNILGKKRESKEKEGAC